MEKSIQELRERRAAKALEAKKLLDANTGDKWTGSVKDQVETLYNEIGACDDEIRLREKAIAVAAESGEPQPGELGFRPKDHAPDSPKVLYNKWIRGGDNALSAEDWTKVRGTMSTTTPGEGGYTVPSLIGKNLIDAMKAFGAMRVIGDVFRTADGKPLSYPGSDGTSEVGELIAQNVTATGADPSFTTVSVNVFKYSSKIIAAPFELLQDTEIDMEAFINKRLAQRLGRIGNQHFTTGTGGGTQPDGVVPRASTGKVGTTGQTLTIIYDDLVDIVHSVDPSYRGPQCAWQTNDALLKVLRKLKDTAGRPIWIPSYDSGIQRGPNEAGHGGYADPTSAVVFDTLLGYRLFVNNDLAVPAANAKSMTFGDHSYYKIRDAMDIQVFRFTDSAYTKLGQVGFLAWMRMGGNLVDTKAVVFYQHSAT